MLVSRSSLPPRGLLALIAGVTLIPLATLLWLGWRLLEQDRILEIQQAEQQLNRRRGEEDLRAGAARLLRSEGGGDDCARVPRGQFQSQFLKVTKQAVSAMLAASSKSASLAAFKPPAQRCLCLT